MDEPRSEPAGPGPKRSLSRPAMLVALGIDALGSGLYLPLSLIYFTQVVHLPLGAVGFALSAAIACTLVVPLIAGSYAAKLGARRVVLTAQLIQGVGYCGYLVVHSIPELFLTALLVGIGERSFWTTIFTYIAESAEGRELDGWYAQVSVIRNLGIGAGALLAGLVLAADSRALFHAAIIANAVSFVVAAALLGFVVRESRPGTMKDRGDGGKARHGARAKGGYREIARDRPFLAFTATNLVCSLCLTIITIALPIYVVKGLHGPGWLGGTLFTINTALLILGQTRVTKSLIRYRRTRVLAVAGLLWAVWALALAGGTLIPHAAVIPYLIAGMVLFTVAEMLQSPTSTALAAATAGSTEQRARYMAVYQYGYQIAKIIAPILFTQLFLIRTGLPWLVLAVLAAGTAPIVLRVERYLPARALRREPPAEEDEPVEQDKPAGHGASIQSGRGK